MDKEADVAAGYRQLDLESLKALAHPLRVQILDALSTYGEFTASGLADRLGESSGATSYHLRQLEKHGFVREVEGKGTGRERWWERVPGGLTLNNHADQESAAAKAASRSIMRQWDQSRQMLLTDFQERGFDELPKIWGESSIISTLNLRLNPEELAEITRKLDAYVEELVARYRGKKSPGSRPVQIHFNAFPVVDGDVTPTTEPEPDKEATP